MKGSIKLSNFVFKIVSTICITLSETKGEVKDTIRLFSNINIKRQIKSMETALAFGLSHSNGS